MRRPPTLALVVAALVGSAAAFGWAFSVWHALSHQPAAEAKAEASVTRNAGDSP